MPGERRILKLLRALARQRVALVLPGNLLVIEEAAATHSDEALAALATCRMRGWVDVLHDAVPTGQLEPDGSLPKGMPFTSIAPVYRLTDSGWAAINRSHSWAMADVIAAVLAILVAVLLAKAGVSG